MHVKQRALRHGGQVGQVELGWTVWVGPLPDALVQLVPACSCWQAVRTCMAPCLNWVHGVT